MNLKTAIGKTIHRIRTSQGMTMRMLEPHVSIGHLSPVERGLKEVSNDMVDNISVAFQMTTAE